LRSATGAGAGGEDNDITGRQRCVDFFVARSFEVAQDWFGAVASEVVELVFITDEATDDVPS
jgi:hypothetical protein